MLAITAVVYLSCSDGKLARVSDLVESQALSIRRQRPDRLVR